MVVAAPARRYEDQGSNFVMIGTSNDEFKKKLSQPEDNLRSGYSHNYHSHNRPSSDYHAGNFNGFPIIPQSPSLVSANIQLLEPFMLVTFVLFVLSLLDRARIIPTAFKRNDNFTNIHDDYDRYRFQTPPFMKMINETDF